MIRGCSELLPVLRQAECALQGVKNLEALHQMDAVNCEVEHIGEAAALSKMLRHVEEALDAIKQTNATK